jgi:hypothetical protein
MFGRTMVVRESASGEGADANVDSSYCNEFHGVLWRRLLSRLAFQGEVGEFGLNHIPAKNAACESGPEGSNPSLSAKTIERAALVVAT